MSKYANLEEHTIEPAAAIQESKMDPMTLFYGILLFLMSLSCAGVYILQDDTNRAKA